MTPDLDNMTKEEIQKYLDQHSWSPSKEELDNLTKKLIMYADNMSEFSENEMTYLLGCLTFTEELFKKTDDKFLREIE